jgi:hypothetical protein
MEKSEEKYVGATHRPRQDNDEDKNDTRSPDRSGEGVRGASGGGVSVEAGAAAMGEHGIEAPEHPAGKDQARHLQAPPRLTWTAADDAMLKRLWDRGGSLTSVAAAMTKALGVKVTRGAVSGRRMRLGMAHARRFTEPRRPRTVRLVKTVRPPQDRPGEVEYLDLPADGCKAVLDKRGEYGLRMCCGRLRALTDKGSLSPYCDIHTEAYRTPQPQQRKPDGKGSEVRKY